MLDENDISNEPVAENESQLFDYLGRDTDSVPETEPPQSTSENSHNPDSESENKAAVGLFVELFDGLVAEGLKSFTFSKSSEEFKAPEDEKRFLTKNICAVLPAGKTFVSPKIMIIVYILKMYGLKLAAAFDLRQKNQIIRAQEQEIARLRLENKLRQEQIENERHKQKQADQSAAAANE